MSASDRGGAHRLQRWASFAGLSAGELAEHLGAACRARGVACKRTAFAVPSVQSFFLGGGRRGIQCLVQGPGQVITFRMVPAAADPMTRVVFTAVGSSQRLEAMKRVCVLEILYPPGGDALIAALLQDVQARRGRSMADISHHPRFQTSPILAWRVRRQWHRWIGRAED